MTLLDAVFPRRVSRLFLLLGLFLVVLQVLASEDFLGLTEFMLEETPEFLREAQKHAKHFVQLNEQTFFPTVKNSLKSGQTYFVLFGARRSLGCIEAQKHLAELKGRLPARNRPFFGYYQVAAGDAVSDSLDIRQTPSLVKISGNRLCTFTDHFGSEELEAFLGSAYMGGDDCREVSLQYPQLAERTFNWWRRLLVEHSRPIALAYSVHPVFAYLVAGSVLLLLGTLVFACYECCNLWTEPPADRKKLVLRLIRVPVEPHPSVEEAHSKARHSKKHR